MPPFSSSSPTLSAYDRLFHAIETGRFAPGDRLRETEIAELLSLSRTPVREALRKLEAEGIVEHRPRVGVVVRSLSHPEIVELYEMRLVLERTAAELAARHATAAETDEITDLNNLLAATDDPAEAARINQNLHRCIYLATRNRFLLAASRGLTNAMMLLGPTTLADEARIATVVEEHAAIIEGIRQSDPAAAGDAAAAHLQTSLRHRLKELRA